MNTTFCTVSVNSRLDNSLTRRASALEVLKSKPAISLCLLLLEQMFKQPFRGCRRSFCLGGQLFSSQRHAMQTQFFKFYHQVTHCGSPRAYKRRELTVAAVITLGLDLLEKCFGASSVVLCPERIGFQLLFQRVVEGAEFVEGCALLVRRLSGFGRSDPFSDGVSRQPGTLGYLVQRELVAELHPPDFSNISMLITLCSPARK